MQRRHRVVDGFDDLLVLMRPSDGQHARMRLADSVFLNAETARNDDPAIGIHGFANGVETFFLR